MSVNNPRDVVRYRAVDVLLGDVIQVDVGTSAYGWAEVEGTYSGSTGADALQEIADKVRAGYAAKTVGSIAVALFIESTHEKNGALLDRVRAGLATVVNVRVRMNDDDKINWVEFRSLDLVPTQVIAE